MLKIHIFRYLWSFLAFMLNTSAASLQGQKCNALQSNCNYTHTHIYMLDPYAGFKIDREFDHNPSYQSPVHT